MANLKVSELTYDSTPGADALVEVTIDPAGTPLTRSTSLADINGLAVVTVNAGTNLSTARPTADTVYWKFTSYLVDPGVSGENIVNAVAGDFWFVPDA